MGPNPVPERGPRVLVVGLDPYRAPGPWDPEPIAAGIEAGRREFADHGVPVEFCLVGLDGSEDVEASITRALTSGAWGCVVIGGGIRGDLLLFEQVANLVHRLAPGAAIAFSDAPAQTYEAAARRLGPPA